MKVSKRTIFIGVAVGVALWYLTTQTRRVDIGAAGISWIGREGANVRINVRIPVINRSDFPVSITGFLGALLYNNSQIGTTTLVSQTTLAPRSETSLEFSTVVSILSVATSTPLISILNALAKKLLGVSIPGLPAETIDANTLPAALKALRIRGTLYLGAVGIDINEPLTV